MNEIEQKFKEYGILRSGLLLLQPSDAIKMVNECRKNGLSVLGIDGFFIDGEFTQPLLEHSIDLSNADAQSKDCWKLAEIFLKERISTDFFFEIVTNR